MELGRPRLSDVSRGIRDNNDVPVSCTGANWSVPQTPGVQAGNAPWKISSMSVSKFYAQYGLKLEPRKVRSFGAPEIGTFYANLERLGTQLFI